MIFSLEYKIVSIEGQVNDLSIKNSCNN